MTAPDQARGLSAETPAEEIIRLLELAPHPEGGFFRETFRDTAQDANGRSASTLIYFLLPAGVISAWHRVDSASPGSNLRRPAGSPDPRSR